VSLTLVPLVLAALAVAAALVYPRADRWGWSLAPILVGAWLAAAGEPVAGGLLAVGAAVGLAVDRRDDDVPRGFNSIVGRLAALGLGVFAALVLVVRFLALDAGLNPEAVLLGAIGLAAVLHLLARPGPTAESRTARAFVAAAAAAWVVASHPGSVSVGVISGMLVVLSLAGSGLAGLGWLPQPRVLPAGWRLGALGVVTLVVVLLPADASLGPPAAGLSLGGIGRAAVLAGAWTAAVAILGGVAVRAPSSPFPWAVVAAGFALAVLRFPLAASAVVLASAIGLPRTAREGGATAWSRVLVFASLAGTAAVAAGVTGRVQGDDAIATTVMLGSLALVAAAPFGWHFMRWTDGASPGLAAVVSGAFLPGALAALATMQPALAAVHASQRASIVLGIFGGITAILGGLYAMGATDWRSLAVRTTPGELGLAMISVAAFDTRGLEGAALTLALLALTRPVLMYADVLARRRGTGLVLTALALLGAAGLPPTLGFPARVLVLSSATRIGVAVAALAVAGVVLEVAAIAMVLRRRLARPASDGSGGDGWPLRALVVGTAVALLGGGLFPAAALHFVFRLGG
jgi:hypothetical protein